MTAPIKTTNTTTFSRQEIFYDNFEQYVSVRTTELFTLAKDQTLFSGPDHLGSYAQRAKIQMHH